jgi:hypothetical protein
MKSGPKPIFIDIVTNIWPFLLSSYLQCQDITNTLSFSNNYTPLQVMDTSFGHFSTVFHCQCLVMFSVNFAQCFTASVWQCFRSILHNVSLPLSGSAFGHFCTIFRCHCLVVLSVTLAHCSTASVWQCFRSLLHNVSLPVSGSSNPSICKWLTVPVARIFLLCLSQNS